MDTALPVVRVIGPTALARAMEAVLSEKGVPISNGAASVLLLLPPGSKCGMEGNGPYDLKGVKNLGKGCVVVRMASDLTSVEERSVCYPPGVHVRALVSVEDPIVCVLEALMAVARREAYCSPRLLPGLLRFLHDPDGSIRNSVPIERMVSNGVLSFRETEVARAAAQGLSNEEIARSLHISVATVKFHLSRVFQKLGVSRRSQIGAFLHD